METVNKLIEMNSIYGIEMDTPLMYAFDAKYLECFEYLR